MLPYYETQKNDKDSVAHYPLPENYNTFKERTISIKENVGPSECVLGNSMEKSIDFGSKISIENFKSKSEMLNMFIGFLNDNNYKTNYLIDEELGKLIISIPEENISLDFLNFLNKIKQQNFAFHDLVYKLELVPIQKIQKSPIEPNNNNIANKSNKKKGLSHESIERLFLGISTGSTYVSKKHNTEQDKNNPDNLLKYYPKTVKNILRSAWAIPSDIRKKDKKRNKLIVNMREPYNETPFCYRSVDKEKWSSPTDFRI